MLEFNTKLNHNFGWIEVICGCMFSGKTELLLQKINFTKLHNFSYIIFKHNIDTRYSQTEIVSHNKNKIEAISLSKSTDIYKYLSNEAIIFIDEVQFFDKEIVEISVNLANEGKKIILSGLDMDYKGKPFEPMPNLLAVADYVFKLKSKCSVSGLEASFSKRIIQSDEQIVLGENESYEPRNRKYFI